MGDRTHGPFLFLGGSIGQEGVKRVNSLVMVSKGEDPFRTTERVLQRFPLPDLKGKNVLIKPNAARLLHLERVLLRVGRG